MQHFHAHALQHNRDCSEADRDVAGTHVLDGFLRDARRLVQAAPFWEEAWPDFLLWKSAIFQGWKRSGIYDRWRSMQMSFCASLARAIKALGHPAYGMVGTHFRPQALVVNRWFEHKVQYDVSSCTRT